MIKSSPVYLRALEMTDLPTLHRWHNDPALYDTLVGAFRPVSLSAEEEWLRKKASYSQTEYNFAICVEESGQHIGNIYLYNINWIARNGELGIFIAEKVQRGKGYGGAALRGIVEYAIQQLGLHRLFLFTFADNAAAAGVAERCGFVVEGRLRQHAYKDHAFKDVLIMGLCAGDT